MRLGIVGLLPGDFRSLSPDPFHRIRDLGCTGAGFHLPANRLNEATEDETRRCRDLFAAHGIDLAQFTIAYADCLFDPDPDVRRRAVQKIVRGAALAAALQAQTYLLRPGSLNPAGSWTPHPDNHRPGAMDRLIATLKEIAPALEATGVTAVMETHLLSILNTPETCRDLVQAVGSPAFRLVVDPVNHFESLRQVYASADRIDRIFQVMGPFAPVCHVKDITVGNRLVLHLEETVPGDGELDLARILRRFHEAHPQGYALIEHLSPDRIPRAAENVRRIADEAGVPIY